MPPSRRTEVFFAALIAIAVVVGGMRVSGVTHRFFVDAAHLYVGFLFGAWAGTKCLGNPLHGCLWLAVALSVLETACAVVTHLDKIRALVG